MRLAYAGAEGCSEAQVFRDAVGAHVRGWDPFAPNAPWRLAVAVSRTPSGYEGSAELRDVTGAVAWARAFPATPTCGDLLEDLAVALALHIDPPQGPPRPLAPSLPVTPLPVGPAPEAPLAAPVPPPERSLVGLRLGATAWADLATAPRPAFGATVDVGYRVAWFSISVELRGDPSASAGMMGGATLGVSRLAGALVPCWHRGESVAFVGCLVGEVGRVEGTVTAMDLQPPGSQTGLSAEAGARLGVEVRLASHLSARGAVDFMGAIARPRFVLDGATLWRSPAFLGSPGLGLVAAF